MQPVPRGAPALRALSRGSGAAELPAESTGPIGAVQRIPSCRAVPCHPDPCPYPVPSRPCRRRRCSKRNLSGRTNGALPLRRSPWRPRGQARPISASPAARRPISAPPAARRPMGARYSNGARPYHRNVGAARAQLEGPGPEPPPGHRALPGLPAAPARAGIP